jgi:hypothetical protein
MEEPVCRHLRTKKMYIPADDSVPASEHSQPAHCWCNVTMTEVGADDRQVRLELCRPGRACYSG